jgi:hypothetical protein
MVESEFATSRRVAEWAPSPYAPADSIPVFREPSMGDAAKDLSRDETAGAQPFARDFGYLEKFLTGLTEHASNASGARGERLRALLVGEAARFEEIRALLSGAEPALDSNPAEPSPEGVQPPAAIADRAANGGFTVGSLLGDRRRVDR